MKAMEVSRVPGMQDERVLVTGGYGFIGSQLTETLAAARVSVISVDKAFDATDERHVRLDLCDGPAVQRLFADIRPTLVYHCGTHSALAYRGAFLSSYEEDSSALCNLLRAVNDRPGCRLVYFSSTYVYSGIDRHCVVTEETALSPAHPFGVAKSFFERLILGVHPESVIYRLSSAFGPGRYAHPNSIVAMAKECLETGAVLVWGEGARNMQFVSVADIIRFLLQARAPAPGIYNLGGDEYLTTRETAELITRHLGGVVRFAPEKKEGETLPFMRNGKIKAACPDVAFTPFATALSAYLDLIKQQA